MWMLSVDPGTRTCGVALWRDGELVVASVVKNTDEGSGPRECAMMAHEIITWTDVGCDLVDVLALEVPQLYQRAAGKSKGDPNKIMPLFGVGAALATLFWDAEVRFGTPHDWKGGVSKPKNIKETYAIHERVMMRLSEEERKHIQWVKNKKHNWDIDDAIGVGLFHLGRFDRVRAFARE